jgi:hypothetical protein
VHIPFSGDEDGAFRPNGTITREQFVKIVIQALGYEQISESYKGLKIFNDVNPAGWSVRYINAAFQQGLIKAGSDGRFRPEDNITFEEAVVIIMRAKGYKDSDVTDKWPNNYMGKARTAGLTLDINLKSSEDLPRWAAAVLVDRLWLDNTNNKARTDIEPVLADSPGLYSEYIILGNDKTCDKLAKNQILTDKGIYYLGNNIGQLELGNKYRMIIDGDTVVLVYDSTASLQKVTAQSMGEEVLTYKSEGKTNNMVLPDKTTYYYNGSKIGYEKAKEVLTLDSGVIFAYNRYKTGYDYAVIMDPVYSEPEVALDLDAHTKKLGDIEISTGTPIIRDGELIDYNEIRKKDVVYKVTDVWQGNEYILATYNKVIGEIEAILPNKLAPTSLKIKDKTYEIGKDMDIDKLNNSDDSFKTGDEVIVLLGYDDKVVDILENDHETGEEQELIILGNHETSTQLSKDQVITDKGTFRIRSDISVTIGYKYSLGVYDNEIVEVYSKLNSVKKYSVENSVDNVVTCRKGNTIDNITLPENIDYYYNGVKQAYSYIGNVLDYNSTIILGRDKGKTNYQYAVILNPIYSEPQIAKSFSPASGKIGDIAFDKDTLVLKGGQIITLSDIKENDVVYEITNKADDNTYLLVVDNRVQGNITAILPHVLSPKMLQVNSVNYNISKDFDLSKINYKTGKFKVGDSVILILSSEGKIIDMLAN